jgi:hypothetical protein
MRGHEDKGGGSPLIPQFREYGTARQGLKGTHY